MVLQFYPLALETASQTSWKQEMWACCKERSQTGAIFSAIPRFINSLSRFAQCHLLKEPSQGSLSDPMIWLHCLLHTKTYTPWDFCVFYFIFVSLAPWSWAQKDLCHIGRRYQSSIRKSRNYLMGSRQASWFYSDLRWEDSQARINDYSLGLTAYNSSPHYNLEPQSYVNFLSQTLPFGNSISPTETAKST